MSGIKALFDSNVIIFASKQQLNIEKLLDSYEEFYTSIITYMEVYGYPFVSAEEKETIDELFQALEVVNINEAIAAQVILYRKNTKKKIKLPDAILLATAKYLGAELITDDWDDFKDIDSQVVVRNIDGFKK